jgi:hypothetical protein
MPTSVASLIEEIRDRIGDYGEGTTALSAAVSSTSTATFYFDDSGVLHAGDFLLIDNELVEVIDESGGTVRRGARGSTAATHAAGAVVRVNPRVGNHTILAALNAAQAAAYPSLYKLVEDTTLTVATDQYVYDIPSSGTPAVYVMDMLIRVEIESETNDGVYIPIRNWDLEDKYTIRIYNINSWSSGQSIKLVGIKQFDPMTLGGNLDSSFPDSDYNALEYLKLNATARVLFHIQARLGARDSFVGMTDSFQNSQPYMSLAVAKELMKESERMLKRARMPLPKEYLKLSGRTYLNKGE